MKGLSLQQQDQIMELRGEFPHLGTKKIVDVLRSRIPGLTAKHVRAVSQRAKAKQALNTDHFRRSPIEGPTKILLSAIEVRPNTELVIASNVGGGGPPYEVVETSSRGKSLTATRGIAAGELLIAEMPLLRVSDKDDAGNGVLQAVSSFSEVDGETYFSMCDQHSCEGLKKTVEGIWETNSITLGITLHSGIFEICSRINSSCTPSLFNSWNEAAGVLELRAIREIQRGEELTICYTDPLASRSERQADLKERYSFECACLACSGSLREVAASDARREELAAIQEKLQLDGLGEKPFRSLHRIKEALQLLQLEGLAGLRREFVDPAYRISFRLGMMEQAKTWAGMGYEYGRLVYGEDDMRVKDWKRWSIKPEKPKSILEMPGVAAFLSQAGS